MNLSKQVKNLGMITAIGAASLLSSAVNAAVLSFAEDDQLMDINTTTFTLNLVAEGLISRTFGGGVGITFDSTVVEVAASTYDPYWNLQNPPIVDNQNGTFVSNVLHFDIFGTDTVNTVSQGIVSIDFNVVGTGTFDFGFFALPRGDGPWVYTPDDVAIPSAGTQLAYCLTLDDLVAVPICIDDDGSVAGTSSSVGRETLLLQTSSVIVEPVPVPAAIWLFGSGLIGLVAVSRRKTV